MPQVALQQATIDYRVLGPEDSPHPPVVFVHGILVDSRLWDRVADGLARQGFRCYLPNWPLEAACASWSSTPIPTMSAVWC